MIVDLLSDLLRVSKYRRFRIDSDISKVWSPVKVIILLRQTRTSILLTMGMDIPILRMIVLPRSLSHRL